MNVILIFSVLVLIAIALWQITKIFELSQEKKINTQVATDKDNDWNGKLTIFFLGLW
jgi:cytochrome c oxidase subunit 2